MIKTPKRRRTDSTCLFHSLFHIPKEKPGMVKILTIPFLFILLPAKFFLFRPYKVLILRELLCFRHPADNSP